MGKDGPHGSYEKKALNCQICWLHYHTPENKRQSVQWKHSGTPQPKKFPASGVEMKMVTVFVASQSTMEC
jgi:hypothetical protein